MPAEVNSFTPTGKTVTLTANTSGSLPTPVQAVGGTGSNQYLITNIGSNVAFLSWGGDAATATANCVVPTGTSQFVIALLPLSTYVITISQGAFFCGITSSGTSVIYITPGAGT